MLKRQACKEDESQSKVISLVGNLTLLMAPHFAFPLVSQHGYQVCTRFSSKKIQDDQPIMCQGWLMVLMASDVGLFLGARTSSRCYLHKYVLYHSYDTVDPSGEGVLHPPFMFFQALVTSMADYLRHSHPLHLHPCTPCRCRCCHRGPALQVSCLDFPLPATVAVTVTVVRLIIFRSSDLLGGNNRSEGINGMLPKDANIQQEVEDAMHEVSNYEFDNMDEEEVRKVISTATLVLLPIFYIYTWLCARSLYLELSIGEVEPSPGQRRPPG